MSSIRNYLATVPWKPIFQRMPGTMLLLVVPFAFLGPIYAPALFAAYYFALHIGFLLNNARSAYGMYVAYTNAKLYSITDWVKKYCQETGTVDGHDTRHDLPYEAVTHVIILPNYKEDMDTLCETLDVLASHSRAVVQYKICLAMEESEQGATAKAATLMQKYANSFFEITYTLHPVGRPGEIRGKSSNVAWAASQMALRSGGGLAGRHDHEILTVMDADTCFAEDFFSAVTYHYTTATPEQRRIMMFAPCTVFDRNSKNVPVFVRVTDMFWSIGVISNLYPSSSIKIPCSAYSVSMDLALAVNFWDAGPEAIGEDMHMYLKCFFATEGRVIVKSIFSPASQCNVEGEGTGIKGYYSYMNARYVQATRHLWGSLDTGYAIRRTLMSFIAPEKETVIPMKNANVSKYGKEEATAGTKLAQRPFLLLELGHRLLESHIMMGHLFTMIIVSALILPIRSCFSYTIATYFWGFLSDDPVHPYVELALNISFWVRMSIVVPNVVMIYYYEKYHQWVGFERWALQDQQMAREGGLLNSRVDSAMDLSADKFSIAPSHSHLRVQPLGKRAQLASERKYPRNLADWFCIPVAGFLFYVVPQFHAQLTQLFTERLDYKVAAKPQLRPTTTISLDGVSAQPYAAPAVPSIPVLAQPATPTTEAVRELMMKSAVSAFAMNSPTMMKLAENASPAVVVEPSRQAFVKAVHSPVVGELVERSVVMEI